MLGTTTLPSSEPSASTDRATNHGESEKTKQKRNFFLHIIIRATFHL